MVMLERHYANKTPRSCIIVPYDEYYNSVTSLPRDADDLNTHFPIFEFKVPVYVAATPRGTWQVFIEGEITANQYRNSLSSFQYLLVDGFVENYSHKGFTAMSSKNYDSMITRGLEKTLSEHVEYFEQLTKEFEEKVG